MTFEQYDKARELMRQRDRIDSEIKKADKFKKNIKRYCFSLTEHTSVIYESERNSTIILTDSQAEQFLDCVINDHMKSLEEVEKKIEEL